MFTYMLALALNLDYEPGRCDPLALEMSVADLLAGRPLLEGRC